MNMAKTLGKLAMGFAAAKAVEALTRGGGSQAAATIDAGSAGGGGLGQITSMLGQLTGGGSDGGGAGSNPMGQLQDMIGGLAGNGGLDLGALTGGGPGGAGGLLSQLTGGGQAGGLLAALGGAAGAGGLASALGGGDQGGGLGGLLDSFAKPAPTQPDPEAQAFLLLRAMLQAAKADGAIDEGEKKAILEVAGEDADADDMAMIRAELEKPVDIDALAADTPAELAPRVYSASLMAIRIDTQAEAQYLDRLASALGLGQADVNALHQQMGAAPLYA
ncbi:MAG: DUF533 domain-containing protein [Marinibacterium sp.]